jgi:hypothetical protein
VVFQVLQYPVFGVFPAPADLSSFTERTYSEAQFAPVVTPPAFIPYCLFDTINLVVNHIHVSSHPHVPLLFPGVGPEFAGRRGRREALRDRTAEREVLARILCQGLRYMQVKEDMVQRGGFIAEVALGV